MKRRWLQALVLLAIGLLILIGLLRSVHPDQVAAAIRHASPRWLALAVAFNLAFIGLRGWRWKLILDASAPKAGLADATAVTAIGFAVNSVSPFKVGELLRMAMIAPRAGIGLGEAGATVVLERVLDVLALVALAVAAAIGTGTHSSGAGLWPGVAAFSAFSFAVGVLAFVLVSSPERSLGWWSTLNQRFPARFQQGASELGGSILRGFSSLRAPGRIASAFVLSVTLWAVLLLSLSAYFRSVSSQLEPATLFLALGLFTISQAVSITPGSVGTYEGFFLGVLTAFGAKPASVVTAIAIISHVGGIITILGCGGVGVLWLRLTRTVAPVGLQAPRARQDSA